MVKFSIIMPTYNQSAFIRRAIHSLFSQTYTNWELIIINDGSTDDTEDYINEYLTNNKIIYIKNSENKGLGYSINQGLNISNYNHIAYLPSDDYYFSNHLELIKNKFEESEDFILVYTTAKSAIKDSLTYDVKTTTNGLFDNYSLQLIQTSHKKTSDRWETRSSWVSDDLFDLFWNKLIDKGIFTSIKSESCYWTSHLHQHHKLINESYRGGLNIYRQYYQVKEPIKIKVSQSKFIDEEVLYKDFQTVKKPPLKENPLKILLVGELAYNPERIFAFEERGHILYGLWMDKPTFSFSTVGPLAFGNVTDIPYDNWEQKIKEIKPDIIYSILNFGAIPLAYEILTKKNEIPFIWHFKESPFVCLQNGTWEKLIELYHKADGKIYLNSETKEWYEQFIPKTGYSYILDGDLPKIDYFTDDFSELLSEQDGEIHTVVPGRIVGIELKDIRTLANYGIHIHLYTENYYEAKDSFNKEAQRLAPSHFHLHPHCSARQWVKEFSKYDAGWLHCFDSHNNGKIESAGWNDLNLPARINTLAAAGLPIIQKRNKGHLVAMKSCLEKENMGIFFDKIEELALILKDKEHMKNIRNNVLNQRKLFSFDHHINDLIDFFKKVIELKKTS